MLPTKGVFRLGTRSALAAFRCTSRKVSFSNFAIPKKNNGGARKLWLLGGSLATTAFMLMPSVIAAEEPAKHDHDVVNQAKQPEDEEEEYEEWEEEKVSALRKVIRASRITVCEAGKFIGHHTKSVQDLFEKTKDSLGDPKIVGPLRTTQRVLIERPGLVVIGLTGLVVLRGFRALGASRTLALIAGTIATGTTLYGVYPDLASTTIRRGALALPAKIGGLFNKSEKQTKPQDENEEQKPTS